MSTMDSDHENKLPRPWGADAVPCPVLFLDVDGVLNRCGKSATRLETDLIDNLVHVVEQSKLTLSKE